MSSAVSAPIVAPELDSRPHMNCIFIGHVDSGKSTTCGSVLYASGQVDERMIARLEKEAKDKNRESWFMAYLLDSVEEERAKGITIEVGRAAFTTPNRRYTILDAPGHKAFLANMIQGATAADIGVLIISARKGEFETGFEKGGQTREHALLAKTLGVNKLIVAINKIDEGTVNYSQIRYNEIVDKLKPYLKSVGFNPGNEDQVVFLPISGLKGENVKNKFTDPRIDWYQGPTLWEVLDNAIPPARDPEGPVRIPVLEGFKDQGVLVIGKTEQGTVKEGMKLVLMPGKIETECLGIYVEDEEVSRAMAMPGENVRIKLKNVEEDQIYKGMVLSAVGVGVVPVCGEFTIQMLVHDLLEHRPLITAGYSCVMHIHNLIEECVITKLEEVIEVATKRRQKNPRFVKTDNLVICRVQTANQIAIDTFKNTPQLGRLTLRDEGKTIAIGKVIDIIPNSPGYGKSVSDALI